MSYVDKLTISEASAIALGETKAKTDKAGKSMISETDWKMLFDKYMGKYLKKTHPMRKKLTEDWQYNFKKVAIYEKQIMSQVTLIATQLKFQPTLDEFKKQYGISDVNWKDIIQLDENAIFEFKDFLNWTEVSKRQFSDEFISYVKEFVDWRIISKGCVSDALIREYYDKLDWTDLSSRGLSQAILEEFHDRVKWESLPSKNYDEKFVVRFYDKLSHIVYTPESEKFFLRLEKKGHTVNWETIKVDNLSDEFIEEWISVINWKLNRENISKREWSREFIESNADSLLWEVLPITHIKDAKFIYKYRDRIDWESLTPGLKNEKFIRVFKQYIRWHLLTVQSYTDEFIIEFADQLYWPNITLDQLKEETLDTCSAKLTEYRIWSRVSRLNLSDDFIIKYNKQLDWSVLAKKKSLSKKIRKQFGELIRMQLKDVYQTSSEVSDQFDKEMENEDNQKYLSNYR